MTITMDLLSTRATIVFAVLELGAFVSAQIGTGVAAQNLPNVNYPSGQTSYVAQPGYYPERPNLVEYGPENGDQEIVSNQQTNGMTINLYGYFPFYSGKYNYTMISTSGYVGFAHFSDNAHDLRVGMDTDWPRESDPALIAPYLCRQRVDPSPGTNSKVYYRVEMRSQGGSAATGYQQQRTPCRGKKDYVQCNRYSDIFLDNMQRMLQTGVAGASAFRAETALVVTWENLKPNIGKERTLSTYQLVWLTDALGTLSYTIINYDKLGYDAADMNGGTVTGRCQALFNGGNHTGTVMVDLSVTTKERPSSLMERSAVPHVVRGRYFHRVDDIVRPAGCSNKTGGSFPLNIYPNIVNMLGQMTVEVNGMCLNPTVTYVLMIEQRESAACEVLNPSVARCQLPKILDWGTKTVFFQPLSGLAHDEKAYVGYIYFVPPTIDPMRLDIGNVHDWFHNPVRDDKEIVWYPRNFTNSQYLSSGGSAGTPSFVDPNNPALYSMQLGLYVLGYKEARDDAVKKFRPSHRILARLATYQNQGDDAHRWNPQKAKIHIGQVEQWFLNDWEKEHELFTYRFGYLKLAPLPTAETGTTQHVTDLPTGLISAPISLHWLWAVRYGANLGTSADDIARQKEFVKKKATEMCHSWFDEDGALPNFIRETETNSSCPCKEEQAKLDLGRYMPHPRCSQLFRDVTCTETLGSRNCYMTAQNVRGAHYDATQPIGHESSYSTHYGQMCCYDDQGYLMQTSYQPVIKIDESTPYSPGFPMRAYEFGTVPYQGMFEVPGMSAFHHDLMPYYLCCKFADFRCQMFYWRRPSSACQQYDPPAIGTIMGSGVVTTLQKQKFIFNDPGVYSLLQAKRTTATPEVRIQARFERFPDRSVDFSAFNQEQWKLVQPTNVTVLTGVALECSDSDRVHVVLRKDTRRFRYRTTILVNDVVRYFDNMQLQRFRGVTVYVNNVQRGQSEVYVVLDKAQVGVRIRESYAIDMDRIPSYMESFGLLDLLVSVPPQYHAVSSGRDAVSFFDVGSELDGLLSPRGDVVMGYDEPALSWSDVNSKNAEFRQRYRIKGEAELTSIQTSVRSMSGYPTTDMFETPTESAFSVLPDANMKRPVYVSDVHFHTMFTPENQQSFNVFLQKCVNWNIEYEYERSAELRRCPNSVALIQKECDADVACLFDAVYLQARLLGESVKEEFHSFVDQRHLATIHYNSCGPISLEYPEYMMKGPSSASPAYLEGDVVSFSCFQDHVSKGDTEYQCSKRWSHHDVNSFVMRWNEGGQPWCRSRQKENFLVWLFWIGILLGSVFLLIVIFMVCWSLKQRQRTKNLTRRNSPATSLNKNDDYLLDDENENITLKPTAARFVRNPNRRSPSSSLRDSPFGSIEKPPMAHRSSSQPFLFDDHVPRYATSNTPQGFSTPQPRRVSHGAISGLSTGV